MACYCPSSFTASTACCTIVTAFCATRSVIWRRSAEISARGAGEGFGIGEFRKTKNELFFLALYFQNSTLKRKLCHTLHKFIRLVYNHLVQKRPTHPLDKNFPQVGSGVGSTV